MDPYLNGSLVGEPLACKSSSGSSRVLSCPEPKLRQALPQACSKHDEKIKWPSRNTGTQRYTLFIQI